MRGPGFVAAAEASSFLKRESVSRPPIGFLGV